jgi:hypothetical protein
MSKAGRSDAGDRAQGEAQGGRAHSQEALDERSRALDPNNAAWPAMLDNRSRQLNPRDESGAAPRGGRGRR